jgi:hypothetical protein
MKITPSPRQGLRSGGPLEPNPRRNLGPAAKPLLAPALATATPPDETCVQDPVHQHDNRAQHELHRSAQLPRINRRQQTPRNEIAFVGSATPKRAKVVFKRRQRALPTTEFHKSAPGNGGNVKPDYPWPPPKEETAAEDEPNEQEMRHQNGISEQVKHTTLRASLMPAYTESSLRMVCKKS